MQKQQDSSTETQERNQKDRVRDFWSRPEITGVAIAFWLFVGGFFLLRLYIYDHISRDPERTTVLIASMFSLALAIVVIIQAGIYSRQAKALDAQLELSRKAVRYSESAYIVVQKAEITKKIQVGQSMEALLVIINSGNTPAYEFSIYGHITACPVGFRFTDQQAFYIKEQFPSKGIVGGNGQIINHPLKSLVASQPDFDAITQGRVKIHIWGIIVYKDVFKRQRWTRFCLIQDTPDDNSLQCSPFCNEADDQE